MNGSGVLTTLIGAGFPFLLVWLKLGAVFLQMSKRKGLNTSFAFAGAFPVWALLFGIWLTTRPDRYPVKGEPEPPADAIT
jgi:hypothetical protein